MTIVASTHIYCVTDVDKVSDLMNTISAIKLNYNQNITY